MRDADGYFDERVAARYDDSEAEMFDAEAIDPVVELMAQLAGMRLRSRWGGWRREPFTSESTKHVSVWEKPGG